VQRRATKQSRGPNAEEKRFQGWLKEHECVWCGNPGPSIVDHCRGATFKHNKTHVGHWLCLSQCVTCDTGKTIHGKRQGNESEAWLDLCHEYEITTGATVPIDVICAIEDFNR